MRWAGLATVDAVALGVFTADRGVLAAAVLAAAVLPVDVLAVDVLAAPLGLAVLAVAAFAAGAFLAVLSAVLSVAFGAALAVVLAVRAVDFGAALAVVFGAVFGAALAGAAFVPAVLVLEPRVLAVAVVAAAERLAAAVLAATFRAGRAGATSVTSATLARVPLPVAARYSSTMCDGMRPRSASWWPCSLAHSRIAGPSLAAARPPEAAPRLTRPPVRRAAAMKPARPSRSLLAFDSFRSIWYVTRSREKVTVATPSLGKPSRSSTSRTRTLRAMVSHSLKHASEGYRKVSWLGLSGGNETSIAAECGKVSIQVSAEPSVSVR